MSENIVRTFRHASREDTALIKAVESPPLKKPASCRKRYNRRKVERKPMSENIVRTFRHASREDTALILEFIRGLAEHEHMLDDVVATEELLEEWIFDKGKAEVI